LALGAERVAPVEGAARWPPPVTRSEGRAVALGAADPVRVPLVEGRALGDGVRVPLAEGRALGDAVLAPLVEARALGDAVRVPLEAGGVRPSAGRAEGCGEVEATRVAEGAVDGPSERLVAVRAVGALGLSLYVGP